MKIIPAIDIKEGKCVRLLQGNFSRETQYHKNPVVIAQKFEGMGFRNLHLVDLDGAKSGGQTNQSIVQTIAIELGFVIQLGGGLRTSADISAWLGAGIKRCVIGSIAVKEPKRMKNWLTRYGADNLVLALDVRFRKGIPMLATDGWLEDSDISLWDAVDDYLDSGLKHVLCTDIGRDGAMAGPNIDLYSEFIERYPEIALQASGGVRNIQDLYSLRKIGSAAAITGRALLDGCITNKEITSFLRAE